MVSWGRVAELLRVGKGRGEKGLKRCMASEGFKEEEGVNVINGQLILETR